MGFSRRLSPPTRRENASAAAWAAIAAAAVTLLSCSRPTSPPSSGAPPSSEPPASAAPSSAPPPSSTPVADAVPPGSRDEPYVTSRTYLLTGDAPRQAWLLCDGLDQPEIAVASLPDPSGQVTISIFSKAQPPAPPRAEVFHLGEPSPGAGQIYWPLTDSKGREAGNFHAFNPGALDSPADAFTPTFTSMAIGQTQAGCRWLARTRFMGFSARRSYLVTQAADGSLEYQTFDFKDAAGAKPVQPDGAQRSTSPTLDIKGGRETATPTGRLFVFESRGYRYTIDAGDPGQTPHAGVIVVQAGKQIFAEPMAAYTIAPRPTA